MRKKLFSILALLLMAVTGAQATDYPTGLTDGQVLYVGDTFTPEVTYRLPNWSINSNIAPVKLVRFNVTPGERPYDRATLEEAADGQYYGFMDNDGDIRTFWDEYENVLAGLGEYAFEATENSDGLIVTKSGANVSFAVHEAPSAPAGTALKPDATRKVWTLDAMPAGNVELQVAYFPGMLTLAQAEGGTIAVDGMSLGSSVKAFDVPAEWSGKWSEYFTSADLPADFVDSSSLTDDEAKALVPDPNSNATLIYGITNEGKVKQILYTSDTKEKQVYVGYLTHGTVYNDVSNSCKYYYTAAPTLPAGFDTDGTNYYVEPKTQFQVKATPAEGYHLVSLSDGTNTYDVDADGIATVTMPEGDADLTLTATFSDEFELTFDDVNFKTNKNITVKVGDADKTLDQDGKLSVKSGQTVTLTAKQGYKFRSVEAKKAGATVKTLSITGPYNNETIYYIEGESWQQAITNHPTENAGWDVWGTPNKVWKGETKLQSKTGEVWNYTSPDAAISSSAEYRLTFD